MAISLISYAKADIRASESALEAVKKKEGNEKALKGIAAYHAQQAIAELNGIKVPRLIKNNAYMYSDWEAAGRYDLHFSVRIDSVEKALLLAKQWLDSGI
ncbi:MAG: hypothetical protein PUC12_11675 [Clostridiales bacterium]|nr:hypothetical protein [Clostridiales bacterium]